jgi:phosphoribosylaminoimidazolecarboxamide formyltransferase/IMP cyclohydrolase
MSKITRAVVSVSDKQGLGEFAKVLAELGVEILSTGGTAKSLREQGITVTDVSEYTGFPEMMEGRVKTLHPKVHGGILADRSKEDHVSQMKTQGIKPIDMVVVNLYPFEATVAKEGCTLAEAIENIDIGGPTLIRASAKNNKHVTVVVDPADYPRLAQELKAGGGAISERTNFELARKAFAHTHHYDGAIAEYLAHISKG